MGRTVLAFTSGENPFLSRLWLKGFARYARTADWRIELGSYSRGDQDEQYRQARISLELKGDGWEVWSLSTTGVRRGRISGEMKNGVLSFVANVSLDPACATMAYEACLTN